MDIRVDKAIIHVLDTQISLPVLSEEYLGLLEDEREYVTGIVEKVYSESNYKLCSFNSGAPLLDIISKDNTNLVDISRHIANSIFNIMRRNLTIPNADLLSAIVNIDSKCYLAIIKLNYRESYIHYLAQDNIKRHVNLIKQRTTLPLSCNSIDEAFLIDLEKYEIRLTEKKYDIEGAKDFYLSSLVISCSQPLTEKEKFRLIKSAAEKSIKESYNGASTIATNVVSLITDDFYETNIVSRSVGNKIEKEFPMAKEIFCKEIESAGIQMDEVVNVSAKAIKRMSKQAFKTKIGVEIRIPYDISENTNEVEFLNNPDGTISLLIKNIIV